jgi:hypothetical protein
MRIVNWFIITIVVTLFSGMNDLLSNDNIITGGNDVCLIADDNIEASSYIKEDSGINYKPISMYDGKNKTAWCVGSSGIGEWVRFHFTPGSHQSNSMYKGMLMVCRIDIINGLATDKNLYFANNRVKKLKAEFSEGQEMVISLKDGVLDYQSYKFNIKTRWVKLTILDVYKGSQFNDTCISEIDFRTIYDLKRDEIKKNK